MLEQIHNFIAANPGTNLIAIDTLEHIRNGEQTSNLYACDYRDMTRLREITGRHPLTLLLIHHTRKMYDPDPLNTISGSTGLIGAVDGVFVLEKAKRTGDGAKLTIANRDTEGFCFRLRFDPENCKWLFIGNDSDMPEAKEDEGRIWMSAVVDALMAGNAGAWSGTPTELCAVLHEIDPYANPVTPRMVTKRLKGCIGLFKEKGISVDFDRSRDSRAITIIRQTEECRVGQIFFSLCGI